MQCNAPKSRFAGYDAETGKTKGSNAAPALVTISGIIGAGLLAALVGLGLLS